MYHRQTSLSVIAILVLINLGLCAADTYSETIHVPLGQPTLQAGIVAASTGDTVLVAPGTYQGEGNRDVDLMGKEIVLLSELGPELTVLDCEGLGYGILATTGETSQTIIDGFSIVNGSNDFGGGAIALVGSRPMVRNCVFSDNSGDLGGAVPCTNSAHGAFENCVFEGNQSLLYGGALYCSSSSTAALQECVFAENASSAGHGGGVAIASKSATISGCIFVNNSAALHGGGIFISGATTFVEILHSTFAANIAEIGAAIASSEASFAVANSIVWDHDGMEAVSCSSIGDIVLSCCNVYGNSGGDFVGCIEGQGSLNGNFSEKPLFCDPAGGDYRLRADSPCAPEHSGGCGLIGALPVGCPASPVRPTTWGALKAVFR